MAPKDPIRNSVNLLIAVGGFAAKPGLLAGLKAGASIYDTLKKMAASPPPSLAGLADELTASAQRTFDATPHLPKDADILFGQMVEFGLPDAEAIVAANMKSEAVCDAMLAKLSDQVEYTRTPMPDLFRKLITPVLDRLLGEKHFTDDLMSVWMASVLENLDELKASNKRTENKVDELAHGFATFNRRFDIEVQHGQLRQIESTRRDAVSSTAADIGRLAEVISRYPDLDVRKLITLIELAGQTDMDLAQLIFQVASQQR